MGSLVRVQLGEPFQGSVSNYTACFFYYSLLLLIDDIYQKNGIIGIHRAVVERKMSLVPKSAIQI